MWSITKNYINLLDLPHGRVVKRIPFLDQDRISSSDILTVGHSETIEQDEDVMALKQQFAAIRKGAEVAAVAENLVIDKINSQDEVTAVACDKLGRKIFVGTHDGRVLLFDTFTFGLLTQLTRISESDEFKTQGFVCGLQYVDRDELLVACYSNGAVKVFVGCHRTHHSRRDDYGNVAATKSEEEGSGNSEVKDGNNNAGDDLTVTTYYQQQGAVATTAAGSIAAMTASVNKDRKKTLSAATPTDNAPPGGGRGKPPHKPCLLREVDLGVVGDNSMILLAVSEQYNLIASGTKAGHILVYDYISMELLVTFKIAPTLEDRVISLTGLCFPPYAPILLSSDSVGRITTWGVRPLRFKWLLTWSAYNQVVYQTTKDEEEEEEDETTAPQHNVGGNEDQAEAEEDNRVQTHIPSMMGRAAAVSTTTNTNKHTPDSSGSTNKNNYTHTSGKSGSNAGFDSDGNESVYSSASSHASSNAAGGSGVGGGSTNKKKKHNRRRSYAYTKRQSYLEKIKKEASSHVLRIGSQLTCMKCVSWVDPAILKATDEEEQREKKKQATKNAKATASSGDTGGSSHQHQHHPKRGVGLRASLKNVAANVVTGVRKGISFHEPTEINKSRPSTTGGTTAMSINRKGRPRDPMRISFESSQDQYEEDHGYGVKYRDNGTLVRLLSTDDGQDPAVQARKQRELAEANAPVSVLWTSDSDRAAKAAAAAAHAKIAKNHTGRRWVLVLGDEVGCIMCIDITKLIVSAGGAHESNQPQRLKTGIVPVYQSAMPKKLYRDVPVVPVLLHHHLDHHGNGHHHLAGAVSATLPTRSHRSPTSPLPSSPSVAGGHHHHQQHEVPAHEAPQHQYHLPSLGYSPQRAPSFGSTTPSTTPKRQHAPVSLSVALATAVANVNQDISTSPVRDGRGRQNSFDDVDEEIIMTLPDTVANQRGRSPKSSDVPTETKHQETQQGHRRSPSPSIAGSKTPLSPKGRSQSPLHYALPQSSPGRVAVGGSFGTINSGSDGLSSSPGGKNRTKKTLVISPLIKDLVDNPILEGSLDWIDGSYHPFSSHYHSKGPGFHDDGQFSIIPARNSFAGRESRASGIFSTPAEGAVASAVKPMVVSGGFASAAMAAMIANPHSVGKDIKGLRKWYAYKGGEGVRTLCVVDDGEFVKYLKQFDLNRFMNGEVGEKLRRQPNFRTHFMYRNQRAAVTATATAKPSYVPDIPHMVFTTSDTGLIKLWNWDG